MDRSESRWVTLISVLILTIIFHGTATSKNDLYLLSLVIGLVCSTLLGLVMWMWKKFGPGSCLPVTAMGMTAHVFFGYMSSYEPGYRYMIAWLIMIGVTVAGFAANLPNRQPAVDTNKQT